MELSCRASHIGGCLKIDRHLPEFWAEPGRMGGWRPPGPGLQATLPGGGQATLSGGGAMTTILEVRTPSLTIASASPTAQVTPSSTGSPCSAPAIGKVGHSGAAQHDGFGPVLGDRRGRSRR